MNETQRKTYRIGLVPDFRPDPPATDGINAYSLSLLTALNQIESPFEYTIFTGHRHRALLAHLDKRFTIVPARPVERDQMTDIVWFFFKLPWLAKRHQIDLLHLFAGNRRISFFPPSKTVVTVHDIYHYYTKELYTRSRYLFCRYILSSLLKRQSHLMAVSHCTAADLRRVLHIPEEKIHVIPNGYRGTFYKPLSSYDIPAGICEKYNLSDEFTLYVSAFDHPRKNHVALIQAYRHLKQNGGFAPDLVFVGTPFWQPEYIYQEMKKHGLQEHIKILKSIPDNDLLALYNLATLFVHPSHYEGFGIPIIEAMACGLPVACSDIPAFREVAGDAAIFFNRHDPVDIAQKIRILYEDRALSDTCRQKGLERAQQFSWQRTARKVVGLYHDILNDTL
ncbi:MAG: glycosyltransferase family 4 protein [bacterium]|nr:glycosyltransferase family 4 protein [bacterium]